MILRLSLILKIVGLSSSIRLEVIKKQTQVVGIGHQHWMKERFLGFIKVPAQTFINSLSSRTLPNTLKSFVLLQCCDTFYQFG